MRRLHKASLAFTVIELLVVIAIIIVIAAILFPVLAQVRRYSQISVCTSNLHQMGKAIAMYSSDWDGGMPYAPDTLAKCGLGDSIDPSLPPLHRLRSQIPYDVRALLQQYGCIQSLFRCPLEFNPFASAEKRKYPTWFEECGSSYWYDDKHALSGFKLSSYPEPASNVIMSDIEFTHLGQGANIDLYTKGTMNLLFADFHVKSHSKEELNNFLDKVP